MTTHADIAARCHLLGEIASITPVTGGSRNAVWRVDTARGHYAVKSTIRSEDQVRWMAQLMDMARRNGLVTPGMVAGPTGAFVENGLTIEDWIAGRPARPDDLAALAPALAALRRASGDWPQRPGFVGAADATRDTVAGDLDMPALPEDLAATCLAAWATLDGDRAVIHGDIYPENVVRTADGRLALIDWDECRRDHPGFDRLQTGETESLELRRAHLAWETALFWHSAPEYARRCATRLAALPLDTAPRAS